jgi:acetolactate synthase-1/2/3 large subunit
MEEMEDAIDWAIGQEGPCICEMMLSTSQVTEPKAASKRLADGSMVSAPLEDMAPFLPEDELKKNMYI